MSKFYEHLTQIVPDFPMVHMMYIGYEDSEFIDFYRDFAKERGYIFDIKILSSEITPVSQFETLDILSPKYHTNSYQYDILFLNLQTVPRENLTHLYERVYACMKNAGGVISVFPKSDEFSLEAEQFLEDINFVAINPIELDEHKKIIYAKKMHGWGGAR